MKTSGLISAVCVMIWGCLMANTGNAQATPEQKIDTVLVRRVVNNYLSQLELTMQQNATAADIDKLLEFYNDSIYYTHVLSEKIRFVPDSKAQIRSGRVSHLGETRNVKFKIGELIIHKNVAVVRYRMSREIKNGNDWTKQSGTTVIVIEFNKSYKIIRVVEYI